MTQVAVEHDLYIFDTSDRSSEQLFLRVGTQIGRGCSPKLRYGAIKRYEHRTKCQAHGCRAICTRLRLCGHLPFHHFALSTGNFFSITCRAAMVPDLVWVVMSTQFIGQVYIWLCITLFKYATRVLRIWQIVVVVQFAFIGFTYEFSMRLS